MEGLQLTENRASWAELMADGRKLTPPYFCKKKFPTNIASIPDE
jgi:hypothetical protein